MISCALDRVASFHTDDMMNALNDGVHAGGATSQLNGSGNKRNLPRLIFPVLMLS